jgi:glycerophosphoryl diester phosphodiesterase
MHRLARGTGRTMALRAMLGAVLLAVVGTAAGQPAAAAPASGDCSTVTRFEHRGDQTTGYTENSLPALRRAATRNDAFETDLRTAADGRIMVMHDATIDRTTTGTGTVAAMTSAEIRSNPLDDGSTVPYLSTVLNLLVHHPQATAMLELKPDAMPAQSLRRVVQMVAGRHLRPRVIVFSFSRAEVLGLRAVNPRFQTSLISDGNEATWSPERFQRYGGANVYTLNRSAEWIAQAHALGLRLIGRDAEDTTTWQSALDAGVVGQVVDDVAGYRAWCGTTP